MSSPEVRSMSGRPVLRLGDFDLADVGYEAAEYAIAGEATSFGFTRAPEEHGMWEVEPDGRAAFTTRIVVLTPTEPAAFNGTVLVEWLNVTGGMDAPADWMMAHREIVRAGYALIAVSAQRVGVEGGASRGMDMSLKTLDPVRYAELHHPGDAYSFDIFTQVGRLVRDQPASIIGSLRAQHVLAIGESQSAWYLTTYVNAIDMGARTFDGFLIHSRFAPTAPLDGSSIFAEEPSPMPTAAKIRGDLRVPAMIVITETDLIGGVRLGYHLARQPDDERVRTWEIAGSAHADNYMIQVGAIDSGLAPVSQLAAAFAPTRSLMGMELANVINFAPQHHYVVQAALAGLNEWVGSGRPPAQGERIALSEATPPAIITDGDGVAVGGIRTPWVDVPIAATTGTGDPTSPIASMFGTGDPFDQAKLDRLYRGGRAEYLQRFEAALDEAIVYGFLLRADRSEILELAATMYPTA